MASIRQKGKSWVASIFRRGPGGVPKRLPRSFALKREAVAWAAVEEVNIAGGVRVADIPLSDLFSRYADEVTPKKRTARTETLRLGVLARDFLGRVRLPDLKPLHIANWCDRRLEKVSPSSVKREMALLSNVFSVAVKEWGLLKENPCVFIKRPNDNLPRDRRISEDEINRVLFSSGYSSGKLCSSVARIGAAFIFAIETGMRLGEICGLSRSDISCVVANLPITKNGTLDLARMVGIRDLKILLVYYNKKTHKIAEKLA